MLKDMYEENHDIYAGNLRAVINTKTTKTIIGDLANGFKDRNVTIFEFLDNHDKMVINSDFLSMFDVDRCLFRAKNNISALYIYSADEVLLGVVFLINPVCLDD